ncbi:MAG: glutamate--tRNA ligase [Candidatus Pacearchaeota archaeon]
MIDKDLIKAYALENAILHNGKAQVNAVLSKLFRHGLKKEEIKDYIKKVEEIVNYVNSLTLEKQKQEFEKYSSLLPEKTKERHLELPNVKGKVIMRLAPFPSGPLHIGNARAYVLNDYFVKKYNGKLLLVIDDTIGSEEKKIVKEAYTLIPSGLKWLGINYEEPIIYKSDRLELYYEYAKKLIEMNKAYVCFCDTKTLRENREKGIECEHRKYSKKKNLEEWENMLDGKYKEGEAVLRIKTSMQHKNPAFRDRVLFRICEREHPRVNKKYKVWPLLEMTWAVDDYLLGITHILRGKELMIETEMEKYIFNIFNWPIPEFIHTGLLSIEGVKISKSKSQEEIAKGIYFGWDDPRTWSLQALKRRGFINKAIYDFCLSFGLQQTESKVPLEVLYSFNRKYIEKSDRYFFISNPVEIEIIDAPNLEVKVPLHPNYPERGYRVFKTNKKFWITLDDYQYIRKAPDGSFFRFMYLFNFYKKDEKFYFYGTKLDKEIKAKMLHWLPKEDNLNARVLMDDGNWVNGLIEKNAKLNVDDIVQFERFGFVRLDAIKKIKEINEFGKDKKEKIYEFWFTHP